MQENQGRKMILPTFSDAMDKLEKLEAENERLRKMLLTMARVVIWDYREDIKPWEVQDPVEAYKAAMIPLRKLSDWFLRIMQLGRKPDWWGKPGFAGYEEGRARPPRDGGQNMSNRFLPIEIEVVCGLGYEQSFKTVSEFAHQEVFKRQRHSDELKMSVKFGRPTYGSPVQATADIEIKGGSYSDLAAILRYLADQLEKQEDRPEPEE